MLSTDCSSFPGVSNTDRLTSVLDGIGIARRARYFVSRPCGSCPILRACSPAGSHPVLLSSPLVNRPAPLILPLVSPLGSSIKSQIPH